jgi:hypothetical protein
LLLRFGQAAQTNSIRLSGVAFPLIVGFMPEITDFHGFPDFALKPVLDIAANRESTLSLPTLSLSKHRLLKLNLCARFF